MPSATESAKARENQAQSQVRLRHHPESLSQPTLREDTETNLSGGSGSGENYHNNHPNNTQPVVPRTQSFHVSPRTPGEVSSKVSDFLGSIELPKSATASAKSSASLQLTSERNQDNLSIDIDEELAKLDLETLDDFGTSSAGTVNHDRNRAAEIFSNEYSNVSFIDEVVDQVLSETAKYDIESSQSGRNNDKTDDIIICKEISVGHVEKELFDSDNSKKLGLSEVDGISTPPSTKRQQKQTLVFLPDKSFPENNQNPNRSESSHKNIDEESQNRVPAMERNKGQANGTVSQPGPGPGPSSRPVAQGSRADLTIPGAVQDTTALRSELLAAVEQNKVEKARRILKAGVDANAVCDDKGRFPLHVAAFFGYTKMCKLLLDHGAQKDQPDTALERTPLLYAAATSPETVKLLLDYKANIHARNKFGAGCLHYAAGASQGECCRILASVGCDVNQRDRQKMTPLHMAARVDDIWSIEVLLEFNADVHARDTLGKTCLMHAAETSEGMVSDYKKMGATFRRLVAAGVDVNATDHDGKNALYYAIQTGSPEAVTILHELGAELIDGVSLLTMGRRFPSLIRPFLDKCVSSNVDTCDAESKHFYIQFDYTCLTFYPKDIPDEKLLTMQHRDETESVLAEMGVLHGLTRCKDSSILSHPVCESLLRLKWKKVKWYLYLDMLLFAVFLAFLTAVIFMEYESDSTEAETDNFTNVTSGNATRSTGLSHSHRSSYCMDSTRNIVVWVILWVLTACLGIREMVQLIQSPLHYVVQVENILELVLVFSVAMLSLAECGVQSFVDARDHFAAVCLIVGWTIQVTLYGKIPVFGVYIRMFAAVAVNILKCLFTYLGLLFAFSLTLHFLFRSQKEFDSVGFTFLKTFAMMIGEIELARTFIDNRDNTYIVPFTSHLMFALFIIFISVILMSLLVALAVCDIASMQREGEYMQLVQQVKVASQLEDALQHRGLLYPQFGMKDHRALHQRKGVIFPNLKDHGKLGKDALEIVITLHAKKLDASNANAISQQIHVDEPDIGKSKGVTMRATNELCDDLLQKLKAKMDMYAVEVEKRNDQMFQDFRGNHERGSMHLNREVHMMKNQLEEMNNVLRELTITVKALGERSIYESSSSPTRDGKRHRSIDGGTGTDFNPTSPELEVTETSTQSSPEPSNQHSRHATNTSSRNQSPSPVPPNTKK